MQQPTEKPLKVKSIFCVYNNADFMTHNDTAVCFMECIFKWRLEKL